VLLRVLLVLLRVLLVLRVVPVLRVLRVVPMLRVLRVGAARGARPGDRLAAKRAVWWHDAMIPSFSEIPFCFFRAFSFLFSADQINRFRAHTGSRKVTHAEPNHCTWRMAPIVSSRLPNRTADMRCFASLIARTNACDCAVVSEHVRL
jgi:hypothetical protein